MEAAADCNTNLDSLFEDLMHPNPRIQEDACREMAEKYALEAFLRSLLVICTCGNGCTNAGAGDLQSCAAPGSRRA